MDPRSKSSSFAYDVWTRHTSRLWCWKIYDENHDEAVDFRAEDLFEERKVSVKSKSIGLAMRLSGVICLLRRYSELVKNMELGDSITNEVNSVEEDVTECNRCCFHRQREREQYAFQLRRGQMPESGIEEISTWATKMAEHSQLPPL